MIRQTREAQGLTMGHEVNPYRQGAGDGARDCPELGLGEKGGRRERGVPVPMARGLGIKGC